jgi:hypothetical protein
VALIYVEAGCSSRRSSDSTADAALSVEQSQPTEQDDTAADALCRDTKQQQKPATSAKGKLAVCAAVSDTLQQQEPCAGQLTVAIQPVAAAAAAAAVGGQQRAAVHKPSWLQRTFNKLLGRCGRLAVM